MDTVDYLGYKITYFSEGFSPSIEKRLEDAKTQVKILINNKIIMVIDFIVPFKTRVTSNLKTPGIINIAKDKVKQIINQGLENNEFTEFEFVGSSFEGVIDLTK